MTAREDAKAHSDTIPWEMGTIWRAIYRTPDGEFVLVMLMGRPPFIKQEFTEGWILCSENFNNQGWEGGVITQKLLGILTRKGLDISRRGKPS